MLVADCQPHKLVRYDVVVLPVGYNMQLNTAQRCVKSVRMAKNRIIGPLFNVESPHFTRISTPTYFASTQDMTSSPTFGRHFSRFEKTVENAASYGFVSNFSGATFCLTRRLVGFLFFFPQVNTFQGLLLTDGVQSYAMYHYEEPLTWTTGCGLSNGCDPATGLAVGPPPIGYPAVVSL